MGLTAVSIIGELSLFALLILLSCVIGVKRYGTPLNPLTMFIATQMGLFTLLSALVTVYLLPEPAYDLVYAEYTVFISSLYTVGVTLPFLMRERMTTRIIGVVYRSFGLHYKSIASRFSLAQFAFMLLAAAASFVALATLGGGGLLWITDSREAYISYRAGVGPFYMLTQWFLSFALLYYLWTRRPTGIALYATLFVFGSAVYYLGSKGSVLLILIIGLVYINFIVHRLPLITYLIAAPAVLVLAVILMRVQGSYSSMVGAVFYFRDYFDTTAQFLSRFDEFGYRFGEGWLSSLWSYVPRAIYPDKPYEYGTILIHQVLFPGAAEAGHTPGILRWSLSYLDFGVAGVFLEALIIGVWLKAVYEYYLGNRDSFLAFVLMIHFCIWPVWQLAPLILVFVWSVFQSVFLRLRWQKPGDLQRLSLGEGQ